GDVYPHPQEDEGRRPARPDLGEGRLAVHPLSEGSTRYKGSLRFQFPSPKAPSPTSYKPIAPLHLSGSSTSLSPPYSSPIPPHPLPSPPSPFLPLRHPSAGPRSGAFSVHLPSS